MPQQFYWHIHHGHLVEPTCEPIEVRVKYIKERKPSEEQKLRLRLIKPVQGELPTDVVDAGRELAEEYKLYYRQPLAVSTRAFGAVADAYYRAAIPNNLPAIEALHAKECLNCPWDGKTIFPAKEQHDA